MTTVDIKLNFGKGSDDERANIQTNGVPITLILDSLKTIMSGLSRRLVEEAGEMVSESEYEAYINARLKVDRAKESEL